MKRAGEDPPLACSLPPAELRARRAELETALRALIADVAELPDGYRLAFAPADDVVTTVARFIEVERRCCPFLSFTLDAGAQLAAISLTVTGPPGTKDFLRELAVQSRRRSVGRPRFRDSESTGDDAE